MGSLGEKFFDISALQPYQSERVVLHGTELDLNRVGREIAKLKGAVIDLESIDIYIGAAC